MSAPVVCNDSGKEKAAKTLTNLRGFFGALEGTRIPGPLIKSQMLYRLSYERIHYKAQYNTILPNNITILPGKMQAFCTKNFPKAVIGQILP